MINDGNGVDLEGIEELTNLVDFWIWSVGRRALSFLVARATLGVGHSLCDLLLQTIENLLPVLVRLAHWGFLWFEYYNEQNKGIWEMRNWFK